MTMDTWVNLVSVNENRGKAIGFYNSAITLGFAIGPLFIGLFGTEVTLPIIIAVVLMIIRTPVMMMIKQQVDNVKLPKLEKKLNFSYVKIAPFIFLSICKPAFNVLISEKTKFRTYFIFCLHKSPQKNFDELSWPK